MSTAPKPKPKLAAPADCDLVNVNYSYYCLSWFVFSLSKCRIHFCDMCQRFLACSFFQQWCYTTLWSFVDRRGSRAARVGWPVSVVAGEAQCNVNSFYLPGGQVLMMVARRRQVTPSGRLTCTPPQT